jgi:3-deoxy-D-manno-octulosonic-acid transferase
MAPPSLGLTLYNLRHKHGAGVADTWTPRPAGPLVWLHVAGEEPAPAVEELARRLIEDPGLSVLLTGPVAGPPRGALACPPPPDTAEDVQAFLDHWRPGAIVLSDGEIRPTLAHQARLRGLPLLMADARAPRLLRGRDNWYPGLMRRSAAAFGRIAAVDDSAAAAWRKAGAAPAAISVTGRMEERSAVLPCLEAERESLARLLASRPVWLASSLPEAEEDTVLAAHRAVLGQTHRLLLILHPADPDRAQPLAAQLEDQGWIVALRSAEQEPTPEVEVFVVDSAAELGLWYRLSPITFLGGSLSGTGAQRSPLEPAALGSAILHGPRTGPHGAILGRLGAARAARAVASVPDLAEALGDLLSPDRAARLAQAAWTVASDGAEATEAILARLRQLTGVA